MGLDFIRNASGKPYIKRWAQGLNRVKSPGLLDINLSAESRTFTAALVTKGAVAQGATVLVQIINSEAIVFDGLKKVAHIANVSPVVKAELDTHHGLGLAIIDRLGAFGTTAEVRLK